MSKVTNMMMGLYAISSRVPIVNRFVEQVRDWTSHKAYIKRGYFSQHGEDKFLLEYFADHAGTYLDVGANHPFRISNTYMLYREGWSGVTVEPIPRLADAHRRMRPRDTLLQVAVGDESGNLPFYFLFPGVLSTFDKEIAEQLVADGEAKLRETMNIEVLPLTQIFAEHFADRDCDLLSVDTEGFDFQILSSNDWNSHRPRMVIFEANNDDEFSKCSDLLLENGYHELKKLGCNYIYTCDEQ